MPWGIIGGAAITAIGAKGAADVTAGATRDAAQIQQEQFDQSFEALAPYRAIGAKALPELEKLVMGTSEQTTEALQKRPGFQFRFGQGQQAVEKGAAAKSGLLSGRAGKELTQFGQGFASAEFDKEFDRLLQLTNVGRGAETSTAAAGQATAANIGNLTVQGGKAQAEGFANISNAVQGGLQNFAYYQAAKPVTQVDPTNAAAVGAAGATSNIPFGG